MRIPAWMVAAGLMIGAQTLTAGQVFFTDFESGVPGEFSGAGAAEGTQGFSGISTFQTLFLRNSTLSPTLASTLTLTSLPSHASLNIGFLLAIIDGWDGAAPGFDDRFNVNVDGAPVFSQNYTNYDLGQPYGGVRLTTSGCSCGFGTTGDNAYLLSLSVPHTASTATIDFFASGPNYAVDDNSWAIDDVSVSADVPEPGSLLLLASGAIALLLRRRN